MTGLLADTHALLWWLADDPRLSARAREVIEAGEVPVHFSAASVWEAEIKAASGKLIVPEVCSTHCKQTVSSRSRSWRAMRAKPHACPCCIAIRLTECSRRRPASRG